MVIYGDLMVINGWSMGNWCGSNNAINLPWLGMVSIAPIKMVIFLGDGANGILWTTLYAMQWLGGSGSEPGVYIYIYTYTYIPY